MFITELQEIWMSKNEAKIYESVLKLWECWVSDISKETGIHRRSIYDTMNRLLDKWVIFSIYAGKENLYMAAEPHKIYEMIHEKELTFKKILPYLEDMRNKKPTTEAAFIYRWVEGYKNYMRDMARVWEDCYFLWAKWNWLSPNISFNIEKDFQHSIERKKKKVQIIFDPRVKSRKDIQDTASWEFRFLPEWFETPWVMDVFWDYVVTFNTVWIWNFWEEGSIFVMINKELADSYRTWFKFIWEQCE